VLREPLVHVLILGVALFLLHRAVAPPRASEEIVVPARMVDGLRQEFQRRTGRPPSATDSQAMIDDFVDEEVLVREALAMGLDRGDTIVRRRLLQKMQLLIEDTDPVPPPGDAELAAYLAAHADRYASPARVTFAHVFVSSQVHPADAAAVAADLKRQLEAGADPARLGDPFVRGRDFRLYAQADVANVFGAGFAADVMRVPAGAWVGPLRSTFGFHVVRVDDRTAAGAPDLAAVRERVEHDWREDARAARTRDAMARLRRRYVVRVEGPA
jgi:peptidyl-prolyl cis-trans isomerase C